MFAIVKIAGRQYRVTPEEQLEVDKLNLEPGESLAVQDVMMVGNENEYEIGTPHLPYSVNLELIEHKKRPKVMSVVFKRRGGMRRRKGHRQEYSVVKVKSIEKG